MTKIAHILFLVFLTVALCSADAPRSKTSRFQVKRNRFLARQEIAEDAAVTPYPSADELKPEVPFDETVVPEDNQPNQPDEVYGPPEDEAPIEASDVAAGAEQAAAEEDEQVAVAEDSNPARLTSRRSTSARRSSVRPAKLRKAAPARLQLKPKFVPQPVFFYVAQ